MSKKIDPEATGIGIIFSPKPPLEEIVAEGKRAFVGAVIEDFTTVEMPDDRYPVLQIRRPYEAKPVFVLLPNMPEERLREFNEALKAGEKPNV